MLTALLLRFFQLNAQGTEGSLVYAGINLSAGNYFGIHPKLVFSRQGDIIIGLHYMSYYSKSRNVPSDYSAGLDILGASFPQISVQVFGFTCGKYVSINSRTGYAFSGGLMYEFYTEPYGFIHQDPGFFNFGSNYTYDLNKGQAVGLLLNPEYFIVGRNLGTNLGLVIDINTYRPVFGIEVGIVFGRFRRNSAVSK
jgi:hypothetical protein